MSFLEERLEQQQKQGLYRELQDPQGVDFSSNDYLGLLKNKDFQSRIGSALAECASGSGGSRLLRGHQPVFDELERKLSLFSGSESALFFSSGYQCNLALLSTVGTKDVIFYSDELNHASLIDGMRLSKAEKRIVLHNNVPHLKSLLEDHPQDKQAIVVVESLYSMTGDRSPVENILNVCEEAGAFLIVDEAHQTGIESAGVTQSLGLQSRVFATTHTAGKALAVSGAWVAGSKALKNYLVNLSRPFIYSTAPSPFMAEALLESLKYWKDHKEELVTPLMENISFFQSQCHNLFPDLISGHGPVFFIKTGSNESALNASKALRDKGFDVRAIRYPTVPKGQEGLRISVHGDHSLQKIMVFVHTLKEVLL